MVAQTIELPNLRRMFIPDDGYTIIDADLKGADAQVVAADAGDEELLQIFQDGVDIHTENAQFIFGVMDITKPQRNKAKSAVHGTNYGETGRGLAMSIGITVKKAEQFQHWWFGRFPKILDWHRRVKSDIATKRCVTNAFGYRIYFFDRPENCFTKALAWIPQSTVGIVTDMGIESLQESIPETQMLLQVHDSAVFQLPTSLTPSIYPSIKAAMEIPIPYPTPLTIPINLSASTKSWGDIEPVELAA